MYCIRRTDGMMYGIRRTRFDERIPLCFVRYTAAAAGAHIIVTTPPEDTNLIRILYILLYFEVDHCCCNVWRNV